MSRAPFPRTIAATPPGQTKVWRRIEAEHPPQARADYPDLLAMAESMLATRRKRFPDLVRRGQLDQADADAQLAAFEAIAADWRWIVNGTGEPASLATLEARQDALDASLDTIAAIAADQGRFSAELAKQAQLVIALRWHAELGNHLALHRSARLTRELRARAVQPHPSHEPKHERNAA